ncbi:bridge-like lipid transfer protein family member 3B isoform X2 [Rhodnius prolixus]|uniref:bridge-like lipid transfer protein family member 3B isoform X2 n=1 Tax=Rhodnius prolixus TaxID=13249 RepID=UPI003D18E005
MVSLIKNQILKHLSRFTKNLSPDKINLSTFKGEGELNFLELDEIVLTELLELPSWARLTSAWCNKVSFRIQWTKLKSVPIFILLDEVKVEVETCEELRSLSAQQGLSSYGATNKYNFINKAIDGMTISVNTVSITFKTVAFTASIQIMRILVESKTPDWKRADLTKTRLKDAVKGQILIFKGLEWQALRLEACSTKDSDLPPLRLLTNKSKCRLTIKKRTSDCFVMGCKLQLILEDLLWVLTDSQLKAVLHFVESLSGLVQKANETTRIRKAARKLEMLPEYQAQLSQQARGTEPVNREHIFSYFDVIETSYHFLAQKIDLHLSDDQGAGRSCHPQLFNGSNVHILLTALQVDYYPYHLAAADRSHWGRYNQANSPHVQWLNVAQTVFKNSLMELIEVSNNRSPSLKGHEEKSEEEQKGADWNGNNSVKKYILSNLAKVMTSCIILRIEDFIMYRVTTNNKQVPKEFIKGDRDRHMFPTEVTLHAEFTYYYYPGDLAFPLPSPKFYVQMNPVIINFDVATLLWLNSFALNLRQSLVTAHEENSSTQTTPLNYIDVKIEAIMPRLVFESSGENWGTERDRPRSLHIQVSRGLVSNVRSSDTCSRADLAKAIHAAQLGTLFLGTEFPVKSTDFQVITDKFIDHVQCKDHVRTPVTALPTSSVSELVNVLSKTLLWTESRDVWCVNLEPLWGDFYGARGVAHNRPVPFLDAFPLKVWLHIGSPESIPANVEQNQMTLTVQDSEKEQTDVHGLIYISNLISLQLNHYQLLFLLRLVDQLTELMTILEMDCERLKKGGSGIAVLGAVVSQVEMTLVMPSQGQGKESSGADAESVIPDTSSMADEIVTNPSIQWNAVLSTNLQDGGIYKRENTVICASPPSDQISIDLVSPAKAESPKSLNIMGLSSVKKGFSNFTSNLIDSLKQNTDDISESGSIRSEGSSDSENYIPVTRDAGDPFSEGIDYGSEALEEERVDDHSGATLSLTTPTTDNHSFASSYKRRDLISVATFKLGQVEFIQQSEGLKSVIKAQIANIAVEECPSIPWDEFQNKFSTRSRGWSEVCDSPVSRPRVRLRKEHSVNAGDSKDWTGPRNNTWFEDMLTLSLASISLSLSSATLAALTEFAQDDLPSAPLPMQISIENISLNILDESGPAPLKILVRRLGIERTKEGQVIVEPCIPPDHSELFETVSSELDQLRAENEQLRRRLAALDILNNENHRLRKFQEEAQELRSTLAEAQDSLTNLLTEKQRLLEVIRNLQMSKSDGRATNSSRR